MPDAGLTDGDRAWLETRFTELKREIRGQDSKIGDLRIDVNTLKIAAPHKCTEAIERHEARSWSHNPYKASGLLASVVGVVEMVKKFLSH